MSDLKPVIKMLRFATGMCLVVEIVEGAFDAEHLAVRCPMVFMVQQKGNQATITFQPLTEFAVDPLAVLEFSKSEVMFMLDPSENIVENYLNIVQNMRAAKSGIVLPGAVPANLKSVQN